MAHIMDLFEEKARNGDAQFAIAYALMEIAAAQRDSAKAVDRLGFNNSGSYPGGLEGLTLEIKDGVRAVADAISSLQGANQ